MAFIARVGGMIKQTTRKHINLELSTSNPSIYQAIRWISSTKLIVRGLSYNTDEPSFRKAFSLYGDLADAWIIMDRHTGRSRGFGFLTYKTSEAASRALLAMDSKELHGRQITVTYAADPPSGYRPGGSVGCGYGGGAAKNNNGGAVYGYCNANYSGEVNLHGQSNGYFGGGGAAVSPGAGLGNGDGVHGEGG